MAKSTFDIKTEAQRGLHATVGAADYAVEAVKEAVADAQKRLSGAQTSVQSSVSSVRSIDLKPTAVRQRAVARRDAVEKRVAHLQADAQKFVSESVESATDTYDDLAKRGETIVRRFRNQPAAKQTVAEAKTTVAKAKTTATQAEKTAKKVTSQAKKSTATAKKTVKKSPAVSSAKATGTAARKTAKSAAKTVS